MLDLDSPRWLELQTAHGSALEVPRLLALLPSLPPAGIDQEPWRSLWGLLAGGGDVYSAAFAAVPHVVRTLAEHPGRADAASFHLPACVELLRAKGGVPVPPDLIEEYQAALERLAQLALAVPKDAWSERFAICALGAIAACKGQLGLAEALLALTPDALADFLDSLD